MGLNLRKQAEGVNVLFDSTVTDVEPPGIRVELLQRSFGLPALSVQSRFGGLVSLFQLISRLLCIDDLHTQVLQTQYMSQHAHIGHQ